uniref:SRR1 domain containing n=1 Tax=Sphenodon punctatus TaxID=8508 RepID=A0A8D0GRP6_SPHPU
FHRNSRFSPRTELLGSEFWDSSFSAILETLGNCLLPEKETPAFGPEGTLRAFKNLHLESSHQPTTDAISHPGGEPPCRTACFQCVCYGLGNFSSCVASRYQLAFLLLLLEKLQIPRRQCYIFDPLFSDLETAVLNDLGVTPLFENEEGKRHVFKPTIFYMIHCGKALYNNLLWRNWSTETLSKVIIIGNSFKGIEERYLAPTPTL